MNGKAAKRRALRAGSIYSRSAMLLVEDVDDRDFLKTLFTEIYADLPAPKVKNKR